MNTEKTKVKYMTKLSKVDGLAEAEVAELKEVEDKFVFRSNDYYNSLIDWTDPNDPIRKIVIPSTNELSEWGEIDASNEHKYSVADGVEHKYQDTALILMNNICGAYCRFCFRKRLFMHGNDDTVNDLQDAFSYIKSHKEINNVLLTGGDPLIVSTPKLKKVLVEIDAIEHIKIIRLGTKIIPFNPHRVLDDAELPKMLAEINKTTRVYIMLHINHPREITPEVREAIKILQSHNIKITNQTPLLKGVNDNVEVIKELLEELSFMGVPPYYMFQCRPTLGNDDFSVPIETAVNIFNTATSEISGLAARVRFVMSHETGKIEILGQIDGRTYFKYHRAAEVSNRGKLFSLKSNPNARWLEDYEDYQA